MGIFVTNLSNIILKNKLRKQCIVKIADISGRSVVIFNKTKEY